MKMYEFYRQCKHEFMSLYKLSTIKDIAILLMSVSLTCNKFKAYYKHDTIQKLLCDVFIIRNLFTIYEWYSWDDQQKKAVK